MGVPSAPLGSWPGVATSPELRDRVRGAKVLAVGAGGIGCELLKTLVLTGFEDIEVIDMDTIETSNLNRQFLFRKRHVGESKARVAAEAVKRFRPNARIVAHQANVKEPQFGVDFFRRFQLVLNGLDNLEARRHVNRLALAAGVPLVESGTAGYIGQVTVHVKGATECFECQPKPVPKSFPVCTIRNTPDKPIHCVVWAKDLLFQRLFGRPDAVTDLDENQASAAATDGAAGPSTSGAEDGKGEQEPEDTSAFLRREGEGAAAYAARIFNRVFREDIERVASMEDLWKTRAPPQPLHLQELLPGGATNGSAKGRSPRNPKHAAQAGGPASDTPSGAQLSASRALGLADAHARWSLAQTAAVFLRSVEMFLEQRADEVGAAAFDKDDALAVDFVTAAANLRASAYGIPTQNLFDTKGMAGNIIHAIATTNAIISGLIVIEALKLLAGNQQHCRWSYLKQADDRRLVQPVEPPPPAPRCCVCGTAQVHLAIDTQRTTLQQFLDKVLRRQLSMNAPTVMCGDFYYEEGEGLEPDEVADYTRQLAKPLAALPGGGIGGGAIVDVSDQAQHFQVQLVVAHREGWDEEKDPDGFLLSGDVPAPQAPPEAGIAAGNEAAAAAGAGPSGSGAADMEDDDICIVDSSPAGAPAQTDGKGKRKRPTAEAVPGAEQDEGDAADAKRQRQKGKAVAGRHDVIEL